MNEEFSGKCPDCSSENFLQGLSGGGSLNIRCEGCGSEFNLSGSNRIEKIKSGKKQKKIKLNIPPNHKSLN